MHICRIFHHSRLNKALTLVPFCENLFYAETSTGIIQNIALSIASDLSPAESCCTTRRDVTDHVDWPSRTNWKTALFEKFVFSLSLTHTSHLEIPHLFQTSPHITLKSFAPIFSNIFFKSGLFSLGLASQIRRRFGALEPRSPHRSSQADPWAHAITSTKPGSRLAIVCASDFPD